MSNTDKWVSELLFWFQVLITIFFFVPTQLNKMTTNVDGVLITTFLSVDILLAVNLLMTIDAYFVKQSRAVWQAIVIYILGIIVYSAFVVMFLMSANTFWNSVDTLNTALISIGVLATVGYALRNKLSMKTPEVRKWLAISLRALPQLLVAWNIHAHGSGKGFDYLFILSFHLLASSRVWQIEITVKDAPHDKHRKALQIVEMVNWTTWTIVTVIWAIY
jgi:hypothetical protein